MKTLASLAFAVLLAAQAGCTPAVGSTEYPREQKTSRPERAAQEAQPAPKAGEADPADTSAIEVAGRTHCVSGRRAIIAPVPLHPVVEVLVKPGDRVKKGQTLVKLDDDEPQADVKAKEALLTIATLTLKEAHRYQVACDKAAGGLPDQKLHEVRFLAIKAEYDEQAAKAALESAKAELEHYTVTAPMDGIVSSSWMCISAQYRGLAPASGARSLT